MSVKDRKYVDIISSAITESQASEINNQDITVHSNGVYVADRGYTGLGVVTVDVPSATEPLNVTDNGVYVPTGNNIGFNRVTVEVTPEIRELSVIPSTEEQVIDAPAGIDGYAPINVAAVDASIDQNIVSDNIRSGVSILGVNGSVVGLDGETVTITPTTSEQVIEPTAPHNGITRATVSAVTSAIDSNIQASNIKSGVAILGVSGSVVEANLDSLSITPTTSSQTITPTSPKNGFDTVTVSAVTSSIDSNIASANIKQGVSILGVDGSVVELKGQERNNEYVTFSGGNVFAPNNGANGITQIIVRPKNYTNVGSIYQVTPTTSAQTVDIPMGYSGIAALSVKAVDNTIDSNITASNIRAGVSILGVTGDYAGQSINNTSLSVTPSTSEQTFNVSGGYTGYNPVTVSAVTSSIDSNITAGNIKDGVTILGVTGTYSPTISGFYRKYETDSSGTLVNSKSTPFIPLPAGTTNLSTNCLYSAYANTPASVLSGAIDLSTLTTLTNSASCTSMFSGCTGITSVNLSGLVNVSGLNVCQLMFNGCTGLTSVNLNSLASITASNAFTQIFSGCTSLTSMTFPALSTFTAYRGLYQAFNGCTSLTSLSFPALTSTSFGTNTNQFYQMLSGVTGCTVHFPSNLQSVIGSWSDVTGGFGGTNTTVLFDLTATS